MIPTTRPMRRAGALCSLLCLVALSIAAPSAAFQAEDGDKPALDAVRLMDAAKERLVVGDTTAAIARALLARELDPDIELPPILIERALMAQPVEGVPQGPDEQALFDLRNTVSDLQRQVQDQSRTLEDVERDLRDDERAEPVVQRLEREIGDLERQVDRLSRDLSRLQRQVDRLR